MTSSGEQIEAVVVVLSGDLDMATTEQTLEALLADGAAPEVRADLAAVDFMDSSGLRALIEARTRLEAEGRRLVVVNPRPSVLRIIEVTNTGHLFGLSS